MNHLDKEVYILKSAYNDIIRECLGWKDVETGCVLVGAQIPQGYIITKVLAPGPQATRTSSSFSPDIDYVQKELEAHRILHPGEDFLGVHHQHPEWLTHPSSGDLQQAIAILRDPSYKINGRLLTLISIHHQGTTQIYPYHITVDNLDFKPLHMEILLYGDQNIDDFLNRSLFLRNKTLKEPAGSFWNDQDFHWHHTTIGRKRLAADVEWIRKEIRIHPKIIKSRDGTLIIKIRKLLVIFPREYPLNPPNFFGQDTEGRLKEIEGSQLFRWNTTISLGDLISCRPYRSYIYYSNQLTRWLVIPIRTGNQWVAMSLIALGNRLNNISFLEKEE